MEIKLDIKTINGIEQLFVAVLNNQPVQGAFGLYQQFCAEVAPQMELHKPQRIVKTKKEAQKPKEEKAQ